MSSPAKQPLEGVQVLDFGHTVMGPSCGMILGDLGADVIKIEPVPKGDPTRYLTGFGAGYFGYFNRNKRSFAVDLKTEVGRDLAVLLVREADVVIENFAPGTMQRLGLAYDDLQQVNRRLIYASLKGFMDGPYQHRLALDEVVQMMTGLAYMTGPSGRPLRTGTSVVDITGGMFAVIAILLALRDRENSGLGKEVKSALFETTVFMMGQHLCYAAQTDTPVPPMPERVSAWAVYDTFSLADGARIFVGITTDNHWCRFCDTIGQSHLKRDPRFATNNDRIRARGCILPMLETLFLDLSMEEAIELCEQARIPFAPVNRPEDLFQDRHLAETGGLLPTNLPSGISTRLPRLPLRYENASFGLRLDPPVVGEHTKEILESLGYSQNAVEELHQNGVIVTGRRELNAPRVSR